MIELHILGPAFGLPSIDVKCLAAIALLQSCLPPDEWVLVSSNDPSVSPFNELPALRTDNESNSLWVAGFRNIASYIKHHALTGISGNADSTFTYHLSNQQDADSEAYLSFLESRGLPLLDLSLYVSSDNYTTLTRSALSDTLGWPQSWVLPQKIRDAAKKRSEHLGLSGLDVDAAREKELKKESEGFTAAIPKSLRVGKKSVTSLLGSSAEQTRFRLEAVTADFFEPLERQLGEQGYFIGDKMAVVDCLALALLSQMTIAEMPQPWLREAVENYPNLRKWTVENKRRIFGMEAKLPWKALEERTWAKLFADAIDSIAESIPVSITRAHLRTLTMQEGHSTEKDVGGLSGYERKHLSQLRAQNKQRMIREIVAGCVGSAGLVGIMVYMGVLAVHLPTFRRSQPVRHGFGEAGALLGLRR